MSVDVGVDMDVGEAVYALRGRGSDSAASRVAALLGDGSEAGAGTAAQNSLAVASGLSLPSHTHHVSSYSVASGS